MCIRDRERQMRMDYPEIVNGIALLVGAGLTVKNAWKKIVDNYEEQKDKKRNVLHMRRWRMLCGKCKEALQNRSVMSISGNG